MPCDVKEFMSFLVPLNLFSDKNGQFKITSKDFITSTFCKNNLDINKSYLIAGDYSEKENVVFSLLKVEDDTIPCSKAA